MGNNIINKLNDLTGDRSSSWSDEAQWRLINRKWLKYSSQIARRMLAALEQMDDMNQKKLAKQAGVSPQQISKIAGGKENLTLETIAKLSEILGKELISFPEYKYSVVTNSTYYVPKEPTAASQRVAKGACILAYKHYETVDAAPSGEKMQVAQRA